MVFTQQLFEHLLSIIPSFLFAIFISALITELITERFFDRFLSLKNPLFVLLSSVIGSLIPICTCGMIPLAYKLQKKGSSWLTVISFLTSGNASSITALLLTLTLGIKITLLRFAISVMFGILVAYVFVLIAKPGNVSSSNFNENKVEHEGKLFLRIIKEFFSLLVGFGPWVLASTVIGVLVSLFLSPELVVRFSGFKNFLSPFLFSLGGFPFYFCAGTDIPLSKALLEKGVSIGSVVSFMTGSPGINLTSFLIYQKWLGMKNAIIYLMISFMVCGLLGVFVNLLSSIVKTPNQMF